MTSKPAETRQSSKRLTTSRKSVLPNPPRHGLRVFLQVLKMRMVIAQLENSRIEPDDDSVLLAQGHQVSGMLVVRTQRQLIAASSMTLCRRKSASPVKVQQRA